MLSSPFLSDDAAALKPPHKWPYDFDKALARIQSVTDCYTQQKLANFLGIRQSSISDAAKRKSISAKWLLLLIKRFDVNPDWILYGVAPKYLHEVVQTDKNPHLKLQAIPNTELLAEIDRRLNSK